MLSPTIRLEIDLSTGSIIATAVASPQPTETTTVPGEAAFPLFGASPLDELRTTLATSLKNFADHLGTALGTMVADVSSLEVATYVSDNVDAVDYDAHNHAFVGAAKRRAMTCIRLDGDTLVLVPEEAGKVDEGLWAIHAAMVDRAQASRSEMIKVATSAASALLSALKQL